MKGQVHKTQLEQIQMQGDNPKWGGKKKWQGQEEKKSPKRKEKKKKFQNQQISKGGLKIALHY